jgi:hypothetical protein
MRSRLLLERQTACVPGDIRSVGPSLAAEQRPELTRYQRRTLYRVGRITVPKKRSRAKKVECLRRESHGFVDRSAREGVPQDEQ